MIQAVDVIQVYVFPEGVEVELAERVTAMVDESDGRLWVRRGKSTFEEQLVYWEPWSIALRQYGPKKALEHCEIASYPRTSRHEEKRAKAVDVMCNDGDEIYRHELVIRYGLCAPIESSPHHLELAVNRNQANGRGQGKKTYRCNAPECTKDFERYVSTVQDKNTVCCSRDCFHALEASRRQP